MYRVVNFNETSIFFENPSSKTIDVKGLKEIIINTKEMNIKISSLLTIEGVSIKLSTFLIFKGKEDKYIEKELNNNYFVKNKNIFIVC